MRGRFTCYLLFYIYVKYNSFNESSATVFILYSCFFLLFPGSKSHKHKKPVSTTGELDLYDNIHNCIFE